MAMNKAEKARVAELEQALALCWPPYAAPAPITREEIDAALIEVTPRDRAGRTRKVALGWVYNAYGEGRIEPAWSDGVSHGRGNHTGDSASQGMGRLYRSEAEAAMALRLEMSRDFARKLAAVDRIVASRIDAKAPANV
jgi:hypothetical protein